MTGGHVTPAIATIQELTRRGVNTEVVFVGRKYAMERDTTVSEEYRLITERKIRFLALTTGRLRRYLSLDTFISLFKVPFGFIQAFKYCLREQPALVVSFGGYIALPVVISAWVLGIPTITHEQSRKPGLANRVIAYFAKEICVTFRDIALQFPAPKTIVTGLPIREEILSPRDSRTFQIPVSEKIIYVTGGVTGSETINRLLFPIIPQLTKDFTLVHQTGSRTYELAQLPKNNVAPERYMPIAYSRGNDHAWLLHRSILLISRSGANTVTEIAALGKIAILIPLQWTGGEQYANAQYLVEKGAAICLNQKTLTPGTLYKEIIDMVRERSRYEARAHDLRTSIILTGASAFAKEILQLIELK